MRSGARLLAVVVSSLVLGVGGTTFYREYGKRQPSLIVVQVSQRETSPSKSRESPNLMVVEVRLPRAR